MHKSAFAYVPWHSKKLASPNHLFLEHIYLIIPSTFFSAFRYWRNYSKSQKYPAKTSPGAFYSFPIQFEKAIKHCDGKIILFIKTAGQTPAFYCLFIIIPKTFPCAVNVLKSSAGKNWDLYKKSFWVFSPLSLTVGNN